MTDRELLELAAKAAGISLKAMEVKNVTEQGGDRFIGYMASPDQCPRGWFNPLTDDGDALRLAVKLGLAIRVLEKCVFVESDPETLLGQSQYFELEMYSNDPYTATRRAIVSAAAEIGKDMK